MTEGKNIGMDYEKVMDLVNDFERRYPVYDWQYEGINFWPLIRRTIFNELREKRVTSVRDRGKTSVVKRLPLALYYNLKLKYFQKKRDFIFSANQAHRAMLGIMSYNRFTDPIMDAFEKEGANSLLIEQSKNSKYATNIYHNERFSPLNHALLWEESKLRVAKLIFGVKVLQFKGFDMFLKEISKIDQKLSRKLSITRLSIVGSRMLGYKKLARRLLVKTKPRAVFLVSYYGEWGQALISAARDLSIISFDIQHALMYPKQCSYNSFANIPSIGQNTLPNYFWTWSPYDENLINEWAKATTNHKAINLGNPWIEAYKNGTIPYDETIGQYLNPTKKLILYSLGNRGDQFPGYLVEFIKTHQNEFQFWLRLHPRQAIFKSEVETSLKKYGIYDMVNLKQASNLPLPEILSKTTLHVTLMSSVVIEAAYFNVPSIVLHNHGQKYFKDHSRKEHFHFFVEAEQPFSSYVKQVIEMSKVKATYEYESDIYSKLKLIL